MTRDDLIKLAEECHWRLDAGGILQRGLVTLYPGDDPDPSVWQAGVDHIMDETVRLWDARQGFPGKYAGSCLLADLHGKGGRPWIIGPFGGKFFSLKSQKIW